MNDLYVGAICVWYPHADLDQRPTVALITAIKQPGVLALYTFSLGGGMPRMRDNVHHVSSERLQENVNLRVEYGGWDTVEAAEERRQEEIERQKAKFAPSPEPEVEAVDPDTAKVLSYFEEGMSVDKIADKMGRGWGEKKVSAIIKEHVQPTV